jgi:molecular chaperone HscB
VTERTPAERSSCWKCRATLAAHALVCPGCEAIQPLVETDLFDVLGVPRRLALDPADLEARYHAASRLVHPDRYQTAGARERELSLVASAAVNRAYRTLRDPVARGRYWLELHGVPLGERRGGVPPALAAEVLETQETLEAYRATAADSSEAQDRREEVRRRRDELSTRLAGLAEALAAAYRRWSDDGGGQAVLDELGGRLAEIAYLGTLLGDVEETLGEDSGGTHHRH